MILISACFANVKCRYDGKAKRVDWIEALYKEGMAIPICPEVLGGLPTPRTSCEICESEGHRLVIDRNGIDRTSEFMIGAERAILVAKACDVKVAILKANSPSCGYREIYDGTFSGNKVTGNGFTSELLIKQGIRIFNEDEKDAFFSYMQDI